MALERAVVGALSHAELVDLVVRQSVLIEQQQATIAEQQALIARLEARIRALEAERDRGDPTTKMPGLKPAATPRRRKAGPRKRRAHGFSRARSAPTERAEHAAAACPRCATPLRGGWVAWRKEVLEVPPAPVRVIEHAYLARRCPNRACRARVTPPPVSAAELGVASGRRRLGVGLVSLIAALRAELRLPVGQIQWYLGAVHGLELSAGAVVGALRGVATRAGPTVDRIRAAIRASPVVHGDETGLREDGANGYLWSFSTPTARYFVRGGRNKEVVDEALGPAFAGVLVTDFYAAYDHYDGPHQRCWAHLLRDIHALVEKHPADAALAAWATQVHGVYDRARRVAGPGAAARAHARRRCEADLLAACAPFLEGTPPAVPQAVLCRRIAKYLPELFAFVADPAVPSTNNAAERSIRPVVVQRKISGGTRSPAGTTTFTTLATLFGTWRARGLDPLLACRRLLLDQAPALPV
ncbi:MAG TPA: IS66 family transposase [Vicinamibacteria bacterium]|nr:IS66 family transposase [Vicinamibacteria bacterium]